MSFIHKTIHAEDELGHDLRELRERAGYSRASASRGTKIPISTLRHWEEDRSEGFEPSLADTRLLRAYVQFLGGREAYFLSKYQARLETLKRHPELLSVPRPIRLRAWDVLVGVRVLQIVVFCAGVALLGGYVAVQVNAMSQPPTLALKEPADGARLDQPIVHIQGKTTPEALVTINGQLAIVQSNGTFSVDLPVPRGATVINVSAKKRHSREIIQTRRVMYARNLPPIYAASEQN